MWPLLVSIFLALAPVQVQIKRDQEVYLYNCYPALEATNMSVFLNYPDGTAVYNCDFTNNAIVVPVPHLSKEQA